MLPCALPLVGDTVIITIGGVVGRVAAINDKDDTFVLETTSVRVKIRFRRSAISSVEKAGHGQHYKDTAKRKMLLPRTDWF